MYPMYHNIMQIIIYAYLCLHICICVDAVRNPIYDDMYDDDGMAVLARKV